MRRIRLSAICLVNLLAALLAARFAFGSDQTTTPDQLAFFESKTRPVLAANCFACHGEKEQRGGIRLDSRESFLADRKGGPLVVPGDPDRSPLIRAIGYAGAVKMPPAGRLRPDEIAAIAAWVKMGAPWPAVKRTAGTAPMVFGAAQRSWWSFRPIRKPALPAVRNAAWCRTPIDRFILAGLEAKGLKPAPPADRRTLIRRAYFDLIGLPPTPAQIDSFLTDRSPNAWEKVIDGLLGSQQFGERWGRHWLDLVRYADSNGLDENVAFANAWRYRDYVVNAFNGDKPYDQFITEQVAGDLLPTSDATQRDQRLIATGFLCLGAKVLAEPDKDKMVMDIVDEQIEVTSKAFLGLTVSCARCHNHKFDPIPTQDYYALAGIFKSTKTMSNLATVATWNERPLVTRDLEERKRIHAEKVARLKGELKSVTDRSIDETLAIVKSDLAGYVRGAWELSRQPGERSLAELPAQPNGPFRLIREAESFDRGNVIKDFDTFGKGIGIILNLNTPDIAEWDLNLPASGLYQVELRYASAEARPVKLSLNGRVIRENAAGEITGSFNPAGQRWEVEGVYPFAAGKNVLRIDCEGPIPHFDKLFIAAVPAVPDGRAPRNADAIAAQFGLKIRLLKLALAAMPSMTGNPAELSPPAVEKLKAVLLSRMREVLTREPEQYMIGSAKEMVDRAAIALANAEKDVPRPDEAMAVEDSKPADCRVHIRGDTQNLGEVVPRHFLTVLGGDSPALVESGQSGRLDMARWIASPSNPLTARVAVNRVWQGHFGTGLVGTAENFGFLGQLPSNPALLDWLAADFATNDQMHSSFVVRRWSIKRLHKLIMMSAAYQMSSTATPDVRTKGNQIDPDNRLLWHMPRLRLDAEQIRDSMLAISGKLDLTMGGSLLQTKNHDYVTNDQSGNAAAYNSPRRSLYLPIIRNALFDMFQAFDFGDPTMVNAKRASTTIAPQALYVMNSPFVLEQSKAFADSLLALPGDDASRLRLAWLRVFGRPPSSGEFGRAVGFLRDYGTKLAATESDALKRRVRAWASLCQILFASNEFIYVN